MNLFDIVFLILFAIAVIRGFQKGLLLSLVFFIAIIIGVIICLKFSLYINDAIPSLKHKSWGPFLIYFLVFLAVYLAVFFICKGLEKLLKLVNLNFVNRLAGAVFGAFTVIFTVSLLFWLFDQVHYTPKAIQEKSFFYKYLKDIAPGLISILTSIIPTFKGIVEKVEEFLKNK